MTATSSIHAWPPVLPSHFDGFYDSVEGLLADHTVNRIDEIVDVCNAHSDTGLPNSVLFVVDPTATNETGFADSLRGTIEAIRANPELNTVFVVGDGYLGTDGADFVAPMLGAAAVSAVRSLALTRNRSGRSNVICVPDAMFDAAGTQRGPLTQSTEAIDVAHSVAFLLGESGQYVSGQTMFVDGGRHLFSSHTA
jgi:hypothetical protein